MSFAVMAHPSREKYFEYIKKHLGADVPMFIDHDNRGIWWNARRAWLAFDPQAEWHCVCQDDLIFGKHFIEMAWGSVFGDAVFSFYMGKRPRFAAMVEEARVKGTPYLELKNLHHECCFAMRTERIQEMIEFCDALNPDSDRYINKYINAKKLKVYFPMPSLVDHRDEKSLHNLNRGRYENGARYFIGV